MMFITPIPPTSSEIAATSPSRVVNTLLEAVEVCRIDPWLITLKLLDDDELVVGWSWLRMSVTSVCAASSTVRELGLHDDLAETAVAGQGVLNRGQRRDHDIVLVGRAV